MVSTLLVLLTVIGPATLFAEDRGTLIVKLYDRRGLQLTSEIEDRFRFLALQLPESSNFNSERHQEVMGIDVQAVHQAYRKTIGGPHLVLSFHSARVVKTVGGDLSVVDVIVDLDAPDAVNALFTIAADGRVVSHAKYSGAVVV